MNTEVKFEHTVDPEMHPPETKVNEWFLLARNFMWIIGFVGLGGMVYQRFESRLTVVEQNEVQFQLQLKEDKAINTVAQEKILSKLEQIQQEQQRQAISIATEFARRGDKQ